MSLSKHLNGQKVFFLRIYNRIWLQTELLFRRTSVRRILLVSAVLGHDSTSRQSLWLPPRRSFRNDPSCDSGAIECENRVGLNNPRISNLTLQINVPHWHNWGERTVGNSERPYQIWDLSLDFLVYCSLSCAKLSHRTLLRMGEGSRRCRGDKDSSSYDRRSRASLMRAVSSDWLDQYISCSISAYRYSRIPS